MACPGITHKTHKAMADFRASTQGQAFFVISTGMALSAAEIETLVADLENQYGSLSREYSETQNTERREELAEFLGTIDYRLARLEEQRLELLQKHPMTKAAGSSH